MSGDVVSSRAGRAWITYSVRVGTCAYMLLLRPPIWLDMDYYSSSEWRASLPTGRFLFSSTRALARVQTMPCFREDECFYTFSLVAVVPDRREIGTCQFLTHRQLDPSSTHPSAFQGQNPRNNCPRRGCSIATGVLNPQRASHRRRLPRHT